MAGRRNDISVVGLDTSESYVEIANANAVEAGVADRAVFRVGDACSLGDHDDNSLDAVISSQSFHYWETPVEVLNEIGRILKPGGVFYITSDRRDLTLWATIVVTLTKWLLPKSVRESWMRSFQGAFTIAEVREIVGQSELSDVASITTRSRMYSIIGKVL